MGDTTCETLDLIAAEGQMFDRAVGRANTASTTTEQLSYLTIALDHSLSVFELIGRLRDEYPDRAEDIAKAWRDLVMLVAGDQAEIAKAALQW